MSGKTADIAATMDTSLKDVKLQAQSALQSASGVLMSCQGQFLDADQTLAEAGVRPGDVLTLQVRQTVLAATSGAFAAILGDGSVVAWGSSDGGDSSAVQGQLKNVKRIQAPGTL